ncbi:MAG: hypothetical protein JJE09_02395 [Bacteroidia bacterium]|nr:hypothetical protein [Bacteroidia bacterium]
MQYLRIPFMALAVINLIAGMWAGLIRIGWDFPIVPLAVHHGAIMVGGFLTTLIALEKVIPLKHNYLLAIPFISALSLMMAIPGYFQPGLLFLVAGSIGLFFILAYYLYLYPRDLSALIMLGGAACLVIGNAMLVQVKFYPSTLPWWMGFIVLTITAERLELTKFLPVSKNAKYILCCFLILFLLGAIIDFHGMGKYISGIALLSIATWMLKHDVISIGLKKEGLTKFSSTALLLANFWLILEGVLLIVLPDAPFSYDILVHIFFIGYTFSMIFAHGPIILPGVLGITIKPFHPILYGWLFLVQGSLLLRLSFDIFENLEGRRISGILSAAGILIYFVTLVVLVIHSRYRSRAVTL